MQSRHRSILRGVNRKDKVYNILTFPTHERYESNFQFLPHNFFALRAKGIKDWNHSYAPMPSNYQLLGGDNDQIRPDMEFDIVLSQNKYGQYEIARQVSEAMCIPLVSIEHTLPMTWWTDKYVQGIKRMKSHVNLFISEYSMKKWGYDKENDNADVIHHAINSDKFCPIENGHNDRKILTVMNDAINRGPLLGWDLYKQLCLDTKMPINPVGDTPTFSKAAANEKELIGHYQNASVFLNTSQVSPIPMSVLEAMSCGCPVVSSATCMIPEIIEDGVNGFISNDPKVLKEKLFWCLKNTDEAKKMGEKARETIVKKFNLQQHLDKWNAVFDSVVDKDYQYLS